MTEHTIDLHSLDAIIGALYRAISGPPGGQDWALERLIHHPDARMVRTRIENGKPIAYSFGLEQFIANGKELLAGRSFFEIEIARKTFRFGNVAQVFSAYEAKETPDSPHAHQARHEHDPFVRRRHALVGDACDLGRRTPLREAAAAKLLRHGNGVTMDWRRDGE